MTTGTVDKPIAYEQRLILFLDFLGFKQIVQESTTDADKVRHTSRTGSGARV